MTSLEIYDMADKIWDTVISRPYEIGKAVGEGTKLEAKLEADEDYFLFSEIQIVLEKLKNNGVDAIKRFVGTVLLDFENLAATAEAAYNESVYQSDKEEYEKTYRDMMAYKMKVHKYQLEDLASLADNSRNRLLDKLVQMYPTRKDFLSLIADKQSDAEKESQEDSRLTGFKKINNQDDIME